MKMTHRYKLPLMQTAFSNERGTKIALARFIQDSERLSFGEKCCEFERVFAEKQKRRDCVLFNSGASANLAILQAYKNLGLLKENDKVAISALTWSTNVMPIIQLGMVPVPVDCRVETLNVMSREIAKTIDQGHVKAFFATNVLGFAGDLGVIRKICEEKNILFIEDNCEALGTELYGRKAGNFGNASSFSFFIAHHMSTIEGGAVCTDNVDLSEMLRIVRSNGWDRDLTNEQKQKWRKKFNITDRFDSKYTFYDLGFNMRPTEITGFIGLSQIGYLDENCQKRQKNYLFFESVMKENKNLIVFDRSHIDFLSAFAIPVLCCSETLRDKYVEKFHQAGAEIRPIISGNIQSQPFYKKYVTEMRKLPGADKIERCGFYFSNYPSLTQDELDMLKNCLKD